MFDSTGDAGSPRTARGQAEITPAFVRLGSLRAAAPVWLRRLGPPLAAFAIAHARLWRAARFAGAEASDPAEWGRWDTAHYFAIAKQGYEFVWCGADSGDPPTMRCGNTAWLPGFPLLMRGLLQLGVQIEAAGAFIAGACALGTLIVFWNAFLGAQLTAAAVLTLLLAAFVPGNIYHHGIFPVSLCTLFLVLALAAYARREFLWAGLAGACAAFSYSSGMFLAAVFGLHLLYAERHAPLTRQARQWLLTSGVTLLGFGAFLVLLEATTGRWSSYFIIQQKYAYEPTWPWLAIWKRVEEASFVGREVVHLQTVFVAVLALVLLWAAARSRQSVDGLLALFVLFYWLVPLAMGGKLSLYRAESMLLPGLVLARRLPVPVLVILLLAAVWLSAQMAVLYFMNVLV